MPPPSAPSSPPHSVTRVLVPNASLLKLLDTGVKYAVYFGVKDLQCGHKVWGEDGVYDCPYCHGTALHCAVCSFRHRIWSRRRRRSATLTCEWPKRNKSPLKMRLPSRCPFSLLYFLFLLLSKLNFPCNILRKKVSYFPSTARRLGIDIDRRTKYGWKPSHQPESWSRWAHKNMWKVRNNLFGWLIITCIRSWEPRSTRHVVMCGGWSSQSKKKLLTVPSGLQVIFGTMISVGDKCSGKGWPKRWTC